MSDEKIQINNPTLEGVKCPKCGSKNYLIRGTGSVAASAGKQLLFGGVGNMVASSRSKDNFEIKPVRFVCRDCKEKFEALAEDAGKDQLLEKPCKITFKRLSSLIGAAIRYQVFLNGVKVGTVKRGSEITFNTFTRSNVIFVTDPHGIAFNDVYEFTAESGGEEHVKFKRKFKR